MKKIIAFFILSSWVIYGSVASAACTQTDVTGTWRIYGEFQDSVGRCSVVITRTGVLASNSNCAMADATGSTPLGGRLFFQRNCHVFGTVTMGTKARFIDAWISKGKDSLSGMTWNPEDVTRGHVITGVK
jgi:hypothetical protein